MSILIYVEQYDSGEIDAIKNEAILLLFNFITKNDNITKKDVVAFIASGKMTGDKNSKQFTFSAKPKTILYSLLSLVQTFANGAFDENNYSDQLGKLLLFLSELNMELTNVEREKVKELISGGAYGK